MSSMRRNPVTGFPEPYDDGYGRNLFAGLGSMSPERPQGNNPAVTDRKPGYRYLPPGPYVEGGPVPEGSFVGPDHPLYDTLPPEGDETGGPIDPEVVTAPVVPDPVVPDPVVPDPVVPDPVVPDPISPYSPTGFGGFIAPYDPKPDPLRINSGATGIGTLDVLPSVASTAPEDSQQPPVAEVNPFASTAPEGSFQAQFLQLQADNPGDPRYAGEVPDYVAPEEIQLGLDNPGDPRFYQGIMSQAPSSMTDPGMMGMMQSPMGQSPSQRQNSPFGGNFASYLTGGNFTGNMGGFGGGGMSGYGGMGTGMSAGGGIMSMANPMQRQMSMMPQQMMQQGGYAPRPQQQQSLYGTQSGSSNNQQSIYGQQQFNSPFAGASRGYYA